MKRWRGFGVTLWERKKERRRSLSFGHKSARELLPAVRYPPFFFFFIPLHLLLKKGGRKKLCVILAQQQFFLSRLQIEIGHFVSDPILPCLLCFCFGIDFFGGILRFLEAFLWGVSDEEGFSAALCFVGFAAFGIGFNACCLCFAAEIIGARNRVLNQIFLILFFLFFWSCFVWGKEGIEETILDSVSLSCSKLCVCFR